MWYETDVRDVLPAIQVPTLILYKTGSRNWSSREHGAYLSERIPGAKLVGVSGSSPVVWLEEPTPIVSAIERFLVSVGEEETDLNRVLATVLFTDIAETGVFVERQLTPFDGGPLAPRSQRRCLGRQHF